MEAVFANKIWAHLSEQISLKITGEEYKCWFTGITAEFKEDEGVLIIYCWNDFQRHWLFANYRKLIFNAVKEASGETYELHFELSTDAEVHNVPIPPLVMHSYFGSMFNEKLIYREER
ncbi:DnaA N-terminal domain-containing protein [Bacillus bombysepticus]|uniref:DnaA N-terminal domain-containing protein n=1 Tax=Bacillus bombysepticus TaxID=658666 RepID=UPI00301A5DB4